MPQTCGRGLFFLKNDPLMSDTPLSGSSAMLFIRQGGIMSKEIVPHELIESKILVMRGHRVMLDRDLAVLYSVET